MELQLALSLTIPTNSPPYNKRNFSQLLPPPQTQDDDVLLPTLSLLPLTPYHDHHSQCSNITKDDDDDGVVGWPPVNYRRKVVRSNTLFVKVKMDGVGIARKVDLAIHQSFHTLKKTLMDMFGKSHQQYSNTYQLAYQDKEGDWLLAQDVPWRSFVACARQLKLVKSTR